MEVIKAVLTRFPDGTTVWAVPAADQDTIQSLHDLTHVLLAKALDTESPTLRYEAAGEESPEYLRSYEEAAVLAIQEYVRLLRGTGRLDR